MKIRSLFSVALLLTFTSIAFSQSVKITAKRTVYRRPKPISSYKRTFTITYPRVSGLSPALNKRVEAAIAYDRTLGLNLKEELGEFQWLEEATYEVNYNKKGILVITLSMDGSAAYPSDVTKTVVVDLKTGDRVTPAQIFTDLNGLAALCRKAQKDEIKASVAEIKKEDPQETDPESLFAEANFKVADLKEFSVNDHGVTFQYNYDFPHVIMALQPAGQFFFDWRELKPFIRPRGLLQRLVR